MVFVNLVCAILAIVGVYVIALVMRQRGLLKQDDVGILAALVTDVALPAVIFVSLAEATITFEALKPVGLMLGGEILMLVLAWGYVLLAKMDRPRQGAVVFAATFGSSAFLGYSVIMQVYPGVHAAMKEAVLISEIGIGYPLFLLGPVLAAWFGGGEGGLRGAVQASMKFFVSPVFFAFVGGVVWSLAGWPGRESDIFRPLFHLCDVLGGALTPLAIICVGLMLKWPKVSHVLVPVAVVVALKLIAKPLLLGGACWALGIDKMSRDVLVILAAMPSAALGVVFLRRYGADAGLAATLVLVTTLLSCVTLLVMFQLVG